MAKICIYFCILYIFFVEIHVGAVLNDEDIEAVENGIRQRQSTIEMLRQVSDTADQLVIREGMEKKKSTIACMIGGGLFFAAGGLTMLTAGTAAGFVTALGVGGTVLQIAGTTMSIQSFKDLKTREAVLTESLTNLFKEDSEAVQKMHFILGILKVQALGYEQDVNVNYLRILLPGFNTMATLYGSEAAIKCLLVSTAILNYSTHLEAISGIAPVLLPMVFAHSISEKIEDIAEESAEKAVNHIWKGFTRDRAYNAAAEAAAEAAKKVVTEAADTGKVAKEMMDEATRIGAEKAVKEATRTAAEKAAKEAAEQALKEAAIFAGGVTAVFGAASMAWDYYNWEKPKETSELGIALRKLAEQLEKELQKVQRP